MKSKIILLAKIGRPHGIQTPEAVSFRAELFHPGGALFENCKEVFDYQGSSYPLIANPKPMGGGWGQAKAVVLSFAAAKAPKVHTEIGFPRDVFPELKDEIYLSDLLGRKVIDENDQDWGRVVQAFDQKNTANLVITKKDGKQIEVPLAWVNQDSFDGNGPLVIPDIEQWDLNPNEASDDADE